MRNTVAFDCWLVSSGVSSFTSTSKFCSPAKFSRTAHFGGNPIRASATTNGSSEGVIYKSLSCGRRALLSMTTLSLVMPCDSVNNSVGAIAADESFLLREEIRKVLSKGKAAGVLRLVFHDAGTFEIHEKIGGMNGSIVFELDRPENKGLKKSLKILEKAKSQIGVVQSVSWADIIALAGAEAVSLCGGPSIPIQLGRIDSLLPDPEGKLPEESLDATSLKQCFERKGFSTQELVALSGAHTLGSKGFGNPTVFDNAYFKILMEKPWLSSAGMTSMVGLPSDRALVEDDECVRQCSDRQILNGKFAAEVQKMNGMRLEAKCFMERLSSVYRNCYNNLVLIDLQQFRKPVPTLLLQEHKKRYLVTFDLNKRMRAKRSENAYRSILQSASFRCSYNLKSHVLTFLLILSDHPNI